MKVSAKDIPVIKANLHLTDQQIGNIFNMTAGGIKQARRRFGIRKEPTMFKKGIGGPERVWFKPGHPYHPWKTYKRKRRCLVVKGNFEFEPKHNKDQDYWLKLII